MRVVGSGLGAIISVLDFVWRQVRSFLSLGVALIKWTSPNFAATRELRLGYALSARFLAEAGQQSLAYGAIVAAVRSGGSALDASIIGLAALIPPATIGIYLGGITDAIPKRLALGGGYALQALACFLIPGILGTDVAAVTLLLLIVHTFGQISGPAESAVLPLLVPEDRLSSAASKISLASSAGSAVGTALVAPIAVRLFGVVPMIFAAGLMFALAGSRALSIHGDVTQTRREESSGRSGWRPSLKIAGEIPSLGTLLGIGVLVSIFSLVLQTLAPKYVEEVLGVDPADAVYVFGPTAAGTLLALLLSPFLHRFPGRRVAAFIGLVLVAGGLILIALQSEVTRYLDPINPLTLTRYVGIEIGSGLRTVGFLTIPIGFGTTLTVTAVQTFINVSVPDDSQGRIFALQSALKNSIAILPMLAVGTLATVIGIEPVLLGMPIVMLVLAVLLARLRIRVSLPPPPMTSP